MANLKTFSGFPIQNLSSDPVPFAQAKINDPYAGTWSSGGNMNTARFLTGGAGSSNSAALAFGGRTPAPADVALTENYNGTAWTEVGDLPAAKSYAAGAGTSTAALSIGGSSPAVTATSGKSESWNGSSWTEITALGRGPTSPQSTTYGSGSGSTTSALFYASDEAGNANARTESWNGSSWTEVADQNTARSYGAGVGTSNSSALLAGGLIYPPASANTEIWDGSSWTEVGDMNQARLLYNTSSGQGSATSALIYSGRLYPPGASSALTESWDGTSWTEVNDLSTARRAGSGGGTATSAILGGGSTSGSSPGHVATTEEWAFSGIPPTAPAEGYSDALVGQMYYNSTAGQFKAVKDGGAPIGTWSSGGSLNTGRKDAAGFGEGYTAAIAAGGYSGGGATGAQVESYNGTSWTETTEMSTQRGWSQSGAGTTTAGLIFGGQPLPPGSGQLSATEEWGGSSWTNGGNLNTARSMVGGAGTQTAGLCFGGLTPSVTVNTEEYNGTAWTEVNNLPVANYGLASSRGSAQTDAFSVGGYSPAPTTGALFYDGTNWTAGPSINTGRSQAAGAGTSSLGLVMGGAPGGSVANTEAFDGTSWSEVADLGTARVSMGSGGKSTTNALVFGGETPPGYRTETEEWAAADFEVKTLTTS